LLSKDGISLKDDHGKIYQASGTKGRGYEGARIRLRNMVSAQTQKYYPRGVEIRKAIFVFNIVRQLEVLECSAVLKTFY